MIRPGTHISSADKMAQTSGTTYKHVDYLWDDEQANKLDALGRLVYRSNCLGNDQRITNTGGGNTSTTLFEKDPLTGEEVDVLWVKGSGGDLRTSKRDNFASLYQDKLLALEDMYKKADVRGVKTPIEDAMVDMYKHATFDLNPRACSIDTPLHAFMPYKNVDHTHPYAGIALAACRNGARITREIYGDEVAWTDWQRTGFDLAMIMQDECRKNPKLRGIVMGAHGITNWADGDKECYETTLDLIERAAEYIAAHDKGEMTFGGQKHQALSDSDRQDILHEVLPWMRGQVSQNNDFLATVQSDEAMLLFANSVDGPRLSELGTACPDHFIRTKIKPLFVDWDPQTGDPGELKAAIAQGLEQYRADYVEYYETCKRPDSPAIRDPNPTVVVIPGVGMVAWGKNKSESRVTGEFYNAAVEIIRGAEAIDEYVGLPRQEAFDIEYWSLEDAKLRRQPPEKELERKIVVVVGAGSGIGKAVAHRVADEGAHVVCADLDAEAAVATARELTDKHGVGIGVSGTGVSNCGPAIGVPVDVTDRGSVEAMFGTVIAAYGGIDHVVVTAGYYAVPDEKGHISNEAWRRTFEVNVHGVQMVAEAARGIWDAQGLGGSLVVTTSVNGVVPKAGTLAYDASKAAANHLLRELAIELAPRVRVNGIAPATVVKGSNMFPRKRVLSSLAKYDLPFSEDETTEALSDRLSDFYAQRNVMKAAIMPEDVAEAAFLLMGSKLGKTTGQIVNVDGGLHEAFLR